MVDTTSPVLSAPASFSVVATSGSGASATDNIGTPTITYSPVSGGTLAVGTTTVTATATDSVGNTASGTFFVTVNTPLTISTQPVALTKLAGASATFSVVATGTAPITYQWRKDGTNITGAVSASYTIPATVTGDAASYDVVITNPAGSRNSNAVTLTVNTPITITTQPVALTRNVGVSATFTVVATGSAPITYQWRKGAANISGATSATYTIPTPGSTDAGSYSVNVTNVVGTVASNAATLTVNTPLVITTQPVSLIKTVGAAAAFSVVATGTAPITYQWRKNGTHITGAVSASYNIPTTVSGDAASYDVVLTNPSGTLTSAAATLTVNTPVAITTQPVALTRNVGTSAVFTVGATGTAPLTYQWRKGGVAIAGATSATYSIASTASGDTASYSVVVTNVVGSVTSNTATLTVNTPLTITSQPVGLTKNTGATASFSVTATGTTPITYQWRKDGTAISGATASAYSISSLLESHAGSYDVVLINPAGSLTSSAAVLKVETPPTLTTIPVNTAVIAGMSASLRVAATDAGPVVYQWRKGGVPIAGATSATYAIALAQTSDAVSYDCVVTGTKGAVTTVPVVLAVNKPTAPTISVQPASAGDRGSFMGGSCRLWTARPWRGEGRALPEAQDIRAAKITQIHGKLLFTIQKALDSEVPIKTEKRS